MTSQKDSPTATLGIVAWSLAFALFALAVAAATGGLSRSFLDPDESAHYINTLFLADWLRAGLPSPMPFARDFYTHFPKLSIGHWPPGWYALLAPLFAIVRPSVFGAAMISAMIAGLPASLVAWALRSTGRACWGLAAGFAYLLLPLVAEEACYFRLDQPVTLIVGLAAIAWSRAVEQPGYRRYLSFGALAAFASLVKGNGAAIILVPVLDIVLAGRWRQLTDLRLWVSGIATLFVVAPWYVVSFKISAGGFNYAPGPAYAWLSLKTDVAALWMTVGGFGIAVAFIGLALALRDPVARPIARLSAAVILATLIFQAAIPAALEDRYVLPAVPWLVALITLGFVAIARQSWTARVGAILLGLALTGPAVAALIGRAPKPDIGASAIVADIIRHPGIWLIDGRAGDEGAVIASAAYADNGTKRIWAVRASQWLSSSDFMGRSYQLSVHSPAEARMVLDRLGVIGTVSIAERGQLAFPHSLLLRKAASAPNFSVTNRAFPIGAGSVAQATRNFAIMPHPDRLVGQSGNIAAIGAALHSR